MVKKLIHTSEAIDYKLSLIDKNKNLLPYPYDLSTTQDFNGFSDIGDGSILIPADPSLSYFELLLSTCVLPTGKKYIVSIKTTDVADNSVDNPCFSLVIVDSAGDYTIRDILSSDILDLTDASSTEVSFSVYLCGSADMGGYNLATDIIIKPQIEEAQILEDGSEQTTPTSWVPYMDKIGTYVDRRFNGATAKIKLLSDEITEIKNNSSGSGISDAFIASTQPPENKKLLWIDTNSDGGLKYHDGTDWVTVPVRFS